MAFLLGLAALVTSWASFQAALWDGEQAKYYSRANALRIAAGRHATFAGQTMGFDMIMIANWMNAHANGNEELETFYRNHLRPEFVPDFEAWLASDPMREGKLRSNPFLLAQYKASLFKDSLRMETEAENVFSKGEKANQISDSYVAITVIFSSVLFFAGIASQFKQLRVRAVMLLIATLMSTLGIYKLLLLPMA